MKDNYEDALYVKLISDLPDDQLRSQILRIARANANDPTAARHLIAIVDASDDPAIRSLAACALSTAARGRPDLIAEIGWLLYRKHLVSTGRRLVQTLERLGDEARSAIPGLLAGSMYHNRLVAVPVKKLVCWKLAPGYKHEGRFAEADDLLRLLAKCRISRDEQHLLDRLDRSEAKWRFTPLAISWIAEIRSRLRASAES